MEEERMTQPNPKQEVPVPAASLARVIKLKPGSTNEASLKAVLPQDLYDANIDQVIDYVMNKGDATRKDERIAERVKHEMGGKYGIIVNEGPAKQSEKATAHFREAETPNGLKYLELEIIVAAEQEAGYLARLYR
ncbi:MAG: hypothetical protein KJ574_03940 [Nanoarchaeota archaeon]|nr:hypothetical protein [Nanoarchaeota archaeon]